MEKYKVKKEDLIGGIADFPIEVVQKMVVHQVEQGNEADVTAFQLINLIDKEDGGFHWEDTIEGGDFWNYVIYCKDFDLFFEKYPKK